MQIERESISFGVLTLRMRMILICKTGDSVHECPLDFYRSFLCLHHRLQLGGVVAEVSASSAGQEAEAPTSENTVADEPASSEETNEPTARASENANALTDTKIEALASELNSLKEQLVIPETEEKKSQYGFGPAASKVYAKTSGLSLGSYSEFYPGLPLAEEAVSTGDAYRFITYIGYKFSDNVVMNSEIEFEHGTTGGNVNGKAGSVSVEFVYLDFLGPQWLNFRTGLLLVPLGIINEIHEPVTYLTNMRPQTERTLMPSTWRNLGAGLHGALGGGFTYKLYGLNGMAGSAFDSSGIRSGRQKGNRVLAEDMAVAARLDWQQGGAFSFGTSAYYGGADHDPTQTAELTHGVAEAHGQIKTAGVLLRALYARSWINGAEASVPTEQEGYYIDAAYDLMPFVSFLPGTNLSPLPALRTVGFE